MPRPLSLLLTALACASSAIATDVTVVIDFNGPHSDRSVEEMKREAAEIMKDSGLRLDWKARDAVGASSYPNLVLVRFKGRCVLEPEPMLYDERGPFAFTYSTEGQVLPFTEVACDHVTASVQSAISGDDFLRLDYLMGRALGRVVAHELVHILTRSGGHAPGGVGQAALSGRELIGAPLKLSRGEVETLRALQRAASGRDAAR
jgi:hypothetical protein